MKKFGTPIGDAPGSANEKLGFDGVGTPPAVRCGCEGVVDDFLFLCLDLWPEPEPEPTEPAGDGWLDGCCDLPGVLGFGAVVVGVEVVGVEVVCEFVPEPVVVWWPPEVVVVAGVEVVGVGTETGGAGVVTAGGQTLEISVVPAGSGAPTGSCSVSVPPVSVICTVTVQSAAMAAGIADRPITVANVATAVTAILSFRLLISLGFVLPPSTTRMSTGPLSCAVSDGRY
jgi:hypothetical protein